ncbi:MULTISPECIES: nucleoid-associated protein [Meridianimaribacter]|uniref:Nucleoid associated protein NdpA n=1 Tax=Meridianimaribacter flavus TaxID=571115 RepID=A0ABY2G3K2_9FLAO|nr:MULTISPECIES: nucleoid-associated protein [Meridianimaribacter]TBV25033.1 nucleoid-associated protein [Meridianimaribacter sp. CL38]TDY10206.1 nucleoid associated protein NdpA [Meridianimaribacter flavus]
MIKRNKASISKCILHKVGNKFNSTKNAFSEQLIDFDEVSYDLIVPYLLRPFTSIAETYRFNHHSNIELNEINTYSSQLLNDDSNFIEVSKHIVTHLFEQSNSAQIKTGDVIVCMLHDIQYEDYVCDAVGIFKIENKAHFFQTYLENNSYDIIVQKGIATKKVDKGCIILNTADTEGKIVLSVDNNNYDTQYWIKSFLNVKYPDDSNQHTKNYIEMCREFSKDVMQPQFGGQEQSNFLAKTVDFFKENEIINVETFKEDVFDDEDRIQLFEDYKKTYESDHNLLLRNQFDVSEVVLKKQKQKIKTEIKLDTNIQIKLDVDAPDASAEYLERGYDEAKKMHYYKVFFNEEG